MNSEAISEVFLVKPRIFYLGTFSSKPAPGNAWCDPPVVVQLAGAGMLTLLVWAYKESAAEVVRPLVAPLQSRQGPNTGHIEGHIGSLKF